MNKIIVLTTDGGDREDGNVYYSSYILVSDGMRTDLKFDEPIFEDFVGGVRDAIKAFEALGYVVERPDVKIVTMDFGDDDEEDDD